MPQTRTIWPGGVDVVEVDATLPVADVDDVAVVLAEVNPEGVVLASDAGV